MTITKPKQGRKLSGDFKLGPLICKNAWRAEYRAEVLTESRADEPFAYRAIVYDRNKVPEYCFDTLTVKKGKPAMPLEMVFYSQKWTSQFPFMEERCEEGRYPWLVVRDSQISSLDTYFHSGAPASISRALKMGIGLCSALENISIFDRDGAHHFNLTPSTVRYDIAAETEEPLQLVWVSGLGAMSREHKQATLGSTATMDSLYRAPEMLLGECSEKADVFSVTLLVYMMASGGLYPWEPSEGVLSELASGGMDCGEFLGEMSQLWKNQPEMDSVWLEPFRSVLLAGMATNPYHRIGSISELKSRLEAVQCGYDAARKLSPVEEAERKEHGFAELAGMSEFKAAITDKFILPLKHKELARQYGVSLPGGILLWGPPGVGKTYCLARLASEAGLNYRIVKPSDIGSIYIHGTQSKISELFEKVRRDEAPVILAFDEAEAIIPSREDAESVHFASETNEFLVQLNKAGEDGVYVVLMSNRPDKIDSAALRPGRIDEKFYIPLPSESAREEFFRIRLGKLEHVGEIDYQYLAFLTEGLSFADLDHVVADASRKAFMKAVGNTAGGAAVPVTMEMLIDTISATEPSVSARDVRYYEDLREQLQDTRVRKARRIGYK